jgi:predicted DsbA family dithiol-disulfide isomerase
MDAIEVFADISCPFAHVGLRRIRTRLDAQGRSDLRLYVRAWPLELVNGRSLDAAFVGEEIADLRAQVAPDLFVGFDERTFPTTTIPALALVGAGYRRGLAVGEGLAFAVRDAVFEEGLDVADDAVLASLAQRAGIPQPAPGDVSTVAADWHEGRRRGVVGSPHFFVGDRGWFCPSLDVRRVGHHLRVAPDEAGLRRLVAAADSPPGAVRGL